MRTVAILLAGGTGSRVCASTPKQFLEIGGRPLIDFSLTALSRSSLVDDICIIMHADHVLAAQRFLGLRPHGKVSALLPGGETRADSTRIAIESITDSDCRLLIHDAARPFLPQSTIYSCVESLAAHDAVATVVHSNDTVVVVDAEGDHVVQSLSRSRTRHYQTPQAFRLAVLRDALAAAERDDDFCSTDDFTATLRYAPTARFALVAGDKRSFKVTDPDDMLIATALAQNWLD